MTPPTTTRRLLTTILLIMMLTTSLARANSCANETDREAVSFNPTIQIFTSSSPEPHPNDTTETRVLGALERMETRQDDLTAALASLQSKQDECLASAEPHLNDTTETRVLDALERMETRQDDLTAALVTLQTQQGELTAALVSLQSKQDELIASTETHLNDTTEPRVLDALERMETRQDELTAALVSLQSKQDECLPSTEPHLNDTTETRVLDALERIETRQDNLTAALASLQSKQDKVIAAVASLPPRDCSDVLAAGRSKSGVYLIRPTNALEAFRVYCDMTTDGGGWTVFQRRQSGNVGFFRRWSSYKLGFGDIENEFWIGNDVLHLLTNDRAMQLRVDLWSFDNETAYAEYSSFSVSDESDYYRLEVGGYQGTAGDAMEYSNGGAFSTRDEDHDTSLGNCATIRHGAWWYRFCGRSSLNGRYYIDGGSTLPELDGIWWHHWKGWDVSMKKTEMKVRPL